MSEVARTNEEGSVETDEAVQAEDSSSKLDQAQEEVAVLLEEARGKTVDPRGQRMGMLFPPQTSKAEQTSKGNRRESLVTDPFAVPYN